MNELPEALLVPHRLPLHPPKNRLLLQQQLILNEPVHFLVEFVVALVGFDVLLDGGESLPLAGELEDTHHACAEEGLVCFGDLVGNVGVEEETLLVVEDVVGDVVHLL